jgi:hypothetical protein
MSTLNIRATLRSPFVRLGQTGTTNLHHVRRIEDPTGGITENSEASMIA